jgi:hypothetical protein
MNDLRSAPRRRTLLGGRIEFRNRSFTVDCAVKDLSDTGARLMLTGTSEIPAAFDLWIPEHGRRYRAQMKWRRSNLVGVAFT